MGSDLEVQSTLIDPRSGHLGVTLGPFTGEGVRIKALHPADLSAKAGLEAGDVLVSIDGARVNSHEEALKLMVDAKLPFLVAFHGAPELHKLRQLEDAARSAVLTAAKYGCLPMLIPLHSTELATRIVSLVSILSVTGAVLLMKQRAHSFARAVIVLGSFAIGFCVVSAGQEVRRCAFHICDGPTMYGTEADCRAPCFTTYAPWQWPAVAATVWSVLVASRAALYVQFIFEEPEPKW